VARRKRKVEERYGPWTAHNIRLCDDLYTIDAGVLGGSEVRLQQVVQIVADVGHAPIEQLRVLDLGALEGLFALEFARRGARVVAIGGREANLEKIRFAKEVLELDRLELRWKMFEGSSGGCTGSSMSHCAWVSSTTWMPRMCSCLWIGCGGSADM
jgi:2-polyprenyl-3-methyl-5-hydroxy-6-metoxy-1,4-benzoquinol methylase